MEQNSDEIAQYLTKILGYKFARSDKDVELYQKYGTIVIDLYLRGEKFAINHYMKYPEIGQIKAKMTSLKNFDMRTQIAELTAWIEDTATDSELEEKKTDELSKYPTIPHKDDRELMIYVWGRNNRDWLPPRCSITKSNNFNASELVDRHPHGSRLPARKCEDVIRAVMKDREFWPFMADIINQIEKRDLSRIGINCRHGKHRSQTCALILQRHYYKKAQIEFIEIGHGG